MKAESAALLSCFQTIETEGLEYAVLHGALEFPENIESDIDIIVRPGSLGQLTLILGKFARAAGGVVCQVIRHETIARYHVLAIPNADGTPFFLKIDASTDFRRNGRVLFTGEELLSCAGQRGRVLSVSVGAEFAAYLTKRVLKRSLSKVHLEWLKRLWLLDRDQCLACCRSVMSERAVDVVAACFDDRVTSDPMNLLLSLRPAILVKTLARHPLRALGMRLSRPGLIGLRVFRRTGYQIAVLGPDGVGKSSLLEGLSAVLPPAFRRVERLHLRPGLLPTKKHEGDLAAPYGDAVYRATKSVLKLGYLMVDYSLGYWLRVWPRLITSTLVLCDRYYLDVVADPRRYRYGGPEWLPRFCARWVPSPDIYMLLSADAVVVQRRKAEVSHDETVRQAYAYGLLTEEFQGVEELDACGSREDVLTRAAWLVLRNMGSRAVNKP